MTSLRNGYPILHNKKIAALVVSPVLLLGLSATPAFAEELPPNEQTLTDAPENVPAEETLEVQSPAPVEEPLAEEPPAAPVEEPVVEDIITPIEEDAGITEESATSPEIVTPAADAPAPAAADDDPLTIPSAPLDLVLSGEGQILAEWSPPMDNGGSDDYQYAFFLYNNDGEQVYDTTFASHTTIAFIDFPVVPGENYFAYLAAFNSVGVGPVTISPSWQAPRTTSGAVSIPTAEVERDNVHVRWSHPLEPGIGLQGYNITLTSPDGSMVTMFVRERTYSVTFNNKYLNGNYEIVITPVSTDGTGTPTTLNASHSNRAPILNDDVTVTTDSAGDATLTATTRNVNEPNRAPVVFLVVATSTDGSSITRNYDADNYELVAPFPGLVLGAEYTFTVTAISSSGAYSNQVNTTFRLPEAPALVVNDDVTVELGENGQFKLNASVQTPINPRFDASTFSFEILPYETPGELTTFRVAAHDNAATVEATLEPGTAYMARIRAINEYGTSEEVLFLFTTNKAAVDPGEGGENPGEGGENPGEGGENPGEGGENPGEGGENPGEGGENPGEGGENPGEGGENPGEGGENPGEGGENPGEGGENPGEGGENPGEGGENPGEGGSNDGENLGKPDPTITLNKNDGKGNFKPVDGKQLKGDNLKQSGALAESGAETSATQAGWFAALMLLLGGGAMFRGLNRKKVKVQE